MPSSAPHVTMRGPVWGLGGGGAVRQGSPFRSHKVAYRAISPAAAQEPWEGQRSEQPHGWAAEWVAKGGGAAADCTRDTDQMEEMPRRGQRVLLVLPVVCLSPSKRRGFLSRLAEEELNI